MAQPVKISAHPTWRKHRPFVTLPKSLVGAQQALGIPPVGFPACFELRRRKGGTDVWLWFENRVGINASSQYGATLRTFKEARVWCHWFAEQHGFTAKERRFRPRTRQQPKQKATTEWQPPRSR